MVTEELSDNIRDHVRQPLENANNEINGVKQDMQMLQDIVNAHNKVAIDKIDNLTASAGSAMLAASFRVERWSATSSTSRPRWPLDPGQAQDLPQDSPRSTPEGPLRTGWRRTSTRRSRS